MEIKQNISLKNRNTFGIDIYADRLVEYYSIEELQDFIRCRVADGDKSPLMHIGGGSNLLFMNDFHGTVLHSCIQGINVTANEGDNVYVRVGAGVCWDDWVQYAIDSSWFGLENLSAIPGEVGASAIQNIGAYGSEAKDFILYVDCVDMETGDIRHFCRAECEYGYRDSIFKNVVAGRYAVTHVHFQLSHSFRPNIEYGGIRKALEEQGVQEWDLSPQVLRQTIIRLRQQKLPDPAVTGNAGSFFKNPVVSAAEWQKLLQEYPEAPHYDAANGVKIPAAWLIEQCGWKGRSLGNAGVYENQPLVLVNNGSATGADIAALSKAIQDDVKKRFGISLETEVNFVCGE